MTAPKLLPDLLAFDTGWLTIALFSQPDCEFCEEAREHYLRPLMASRTKRVAVAEFRLNGARRITIWSRDTPTEAEFARQRKVRFAPTIMFFGFAGEELAPPIVGLSRDFFGAYLDQRIQVALKALG